MLRGGAEGEEVNVALEFLNFPPINGYSKELREVSCWTFFTVFSSDVASRLEHEYQYSSKYSVYSLCPMYLELCCVCTKQSFTE